MIDFNHIMIILFECCINYKIWIMIGPHYERLA